MGGNAGYFDCTWNLEFMEKEAKLSLIIIKYTLYLLLCNINLVVRKPVRLDTNRIRLDTNRPTPLQNIARCLKIWIRT